MLESRQLDFEEVRRLTITALFSDDALFQQLVLKGGNAIALVHRLSARTSFDLDFSIEEDFDDIDEARRRCFSALKARFDSAGFVVFDEKMEAKPKLHGPDERPWWGGYELTFKLISKEKHERLKTRLNKMRISALVVGTSQTPTLRVDISKNEYVAGRVERELDHFTIRVYTLAMIAAEKLRALCQQMPEYELRPTGRGRARDFYDIYLAVAVAGVRLDEPDNVALLVAMFNAKHVPIQLLGKISSQREFHRPDWPDVVSQASGELESFDFYFDFVVGEVEKLKAIWNV